MSVVELLRCKQDKIFRHKHLSTGTNFVHVYIEIWDKATQKLKKNNNVIL